MPDNSALLEFFEIDASNHVADTVLRYCNFVEAGTGEDFLFDGELYSPIPIDSEGWEKSINGSLPTPTVTVGDAGYRVSRLVRSLGHLRDSKVTRRRITRNNLDSPDLQDPPDIFYVNFPSYNPGVSVTLTLKSPLDFGAGKYPIRTIASILNA